MCERAIAATGVETTMNVREAVRPWFEIALVCAAGFIPGMPTPLLAMLAVASVLRWVSGGSWADGGLGSPQVARDVVAGVVVGALAFVGVALLAGSAEVPGDLAIVRGNSEALLVVLVLSTALAAAAEMIFRGFILPRVAAATGGNWHLGNLVAAILSGVAIGAGAGWLAMLGAALVGLGFGYLYLGGGRRLLLPVVAHAAFEVAAIIAAALQL